MAEGPAGAGYGALQELDSCQVLGRACRKPGLEQEFGGR